MTLPMICPVARCPCCGETEGRKHHERNPDRARPNDSSSRNMFSRFAGHFSCRLLKRDQENLYGIHIFIPLRRMMWASRENVPAPTPNFHGCSKDVSIEYGPRLYSACGLRPSESHHGHSRRQDVKKSRGSYTRGMMDILKIVCVDRLYPLDGYREGPARPVELSDSYEACKGLVAKRNDHCTNCDAYRSTARFTARSPGFTAQRDVPRLGVRSSLYPLG